MWDSRIVVKSFGVLGRLDIFKMARIAFDMRTFIFIIDLLMVLISEIKCFNLDVRIPVIKQGDDGSLFGFSVAEHIKTSAKPSHDAGYADSM